MKATGIVRRIDDLGRIVVSKEIRGALGIKEGDSFEFFIDGDQIIIKKYLETCVFCGCKTEIILLDKGVCKKCQDKIETELYHVIMDRMNEGEEIEKVKAVKKNEK